MVEVVTGWGRTVVPTALLAAAVAAFVIFSTEATPLGAPLLPVSALLFLRICWGSALKAVFKHNWLWKIKGFEGTQRFLQFADGDAIPYIWNSLEGAEDLGNRLANAGYPVVLCNVTNFYFDLAYNKDPREPGLYWGGFINTTDAFEFVPYNLLRSVRADPGGRLYTDADFVGKERLTEAGRANVLGLQGQLWSETLRGQDRLGRCHFGRRTACAGTQRKGGGRDQERAFHRAFTAGI